MPVASRLRTTALSALLVSIALPAPPADGVPLRVRARAELDVHAERRPDGLVLRGVLRDDAGDPAPKQPLRVDVGGLAGRSVRTGPGGDFEVLVAAEDVRDLAERIGERIAWEVRYEGSTTWGPVRAEGAVRLDREPTRLTLEVDPPTATFDEESVALRVAIRASDGPVGEVPVRVKVADGPELLGESDDQGRVVFLLRPASLERVGRFEIRARWKGDARYAPARARASLEILRPTRLTLRVGREGDLHSGRYRFSGRLSDDRGPVPGATVAIVAHGPDAGAAAGRTLAAGLTDEDGIFLAALPLRELAGRRPSSLTVRAVYQPPGGTRSVARSGPTRIPIPGPPGVPLAWYLASIAAGLGVVLLLLAIRLRFWEDVARALRRWATGRRRGPRRSAPPPEPPLIVEPARGGDLRSDWLSGVLVDAHTGRALPGATGILEGPSGQRRSLGADGGGRFEIGPLPEGPWRISLEADSCLPRTQAIRIPHDGSLDGATLALVSIRGRVRDVFVAAVGKLQGGVRWGVDTPAEAARRVSLPGGSDAERLIALRSLVERAWFGATPPTPEDVREAERLLRELEEAA